MSLAWEQKEVRRLLRRLRGAGGTRACRLQVSPSGRRRSARVGASRYRAGSPTAERAAPFCTPWTII